MRIPALHMFEQCLAPLFGHAGPVLYEVLHRLLEVLCLRLPAQRQVAVLRDDVVHAHFYLVHLRSPLSCHTHMATARLHS